jgi:hypothetical protein
MGSYLIRMRPVVQIEDSQAVGSAMSAHGRIRMHSHYMRKALFLQPSLNGSDNFLRRAGVGYEDFFIVRAVAGMKDILHVVGDGLGEIAADFLPTIILPFETMISGLICSRLAPRTATIEQRPSLWRYSMFSRVKEACVAPTRAETKRRAISSAERPASSSLWAWMANKAIPEESVRESLRRRE